MNTCVYLTLRHLFPDNEMLRRQFAEKANQVGPWIEKQLDAVTAIGMGLQVKHCLMNNIFCLLNNLFNAYSVVYRVLLKTSSTG